MIEGFDNMEHGSTSYVSLLIIVLLAAFIPIIVKKIRFLPIPIVVGEIVAGMVIGKSGFDLIEPSPWLSFLSTFGFAFLMFLSGLEIEMDLLTHTNKQSQTKWFKQPLALATLIFILTLALSGTISYFMMVLGLIGNASLMTLILSTTSLGIVVPLLKEKGLLSQEYGQTLLLAALIADFITMFLITIYVALYTSGLTYKVLLVLLLFVAFFVFYRMGSKVVKAKIIDELAHATSQIRVRGSFALILIFIALAQQLGSEIILGAFLAGLIVSLISGHNSAELFLKLDAIGYGFFVPIFFIMVGANFDIQTVLQNPNSIYLVPLLLVTVYLVKIVPSLILRLKYSWKESLGAGFLLSSRLSLIIAASAIGVKLGAINETTNGAIILVAIFTCTVSPLLFEPFAPSAKALEKNKVYIIGINERVLLLAQRLNKVGKEVTMVTSSKERYKKTQQFKENVHYGDILDVDWLRSIGLDQAETVVVATNDEDTNTEVIRICKEVFNKDHLVLLTNSQSIPEGTKLYGAMAVSPEFATVFMAENLVTHPKALSLFSDEDDNLQIIEVVLRNRSLFNKPLKKVRLPGDCLILSIIRNGEKIIPHGNNILQENDLIMLVGTADFVKEAEDIIGNR